MTCCILCWSSLVNDANVLLHMRLIIRTILMILLHSPHSASHVLLVCHIQQSQYLHSLMFSFIYNIALITFVLGLRCHFFRNYKWQKIADTLMHQLRSLQCGVKFWQWQCGPEMEVSGSVNELDSGICPLVDYLHDPSTRGQVCWSMGKFWSVMGHFALTVSLKYKGIINGARLLLDNSILEHF